MVIDLKKIQSLQKKYQNDHIALSALQNMVAVVTNQTEENLKGSIAFDTLKELGVLVSSDPKAKEPQQLNS